MGSVIDYEKCNLCGGVKRTDYYYHTDEEKQFCEKAPERQR